MLKTGATARLDASVIFEVAVWLLFYFCLQLRAVWIAASRRVAPTIAFTPDIPRPWYLVRSAAAWRGMRLVEEAKADAVMFFEDATWSAAPSFPAHAAVFNFACLDISKSRVADIFETVFGYPLAIDPQTHRGPAVAKSEVNSLHDGRVVECPCDPLPGLVYQRLIDTSDGASLCDLRTPCVGGRPVLVLEKRRPANKLFSVHNRRVRLLSPDNVFSSAELTSIGAFCGMFGLDWGSLDILRDRISGRIYIVDVNKTDVGPVIALPLLAKLRSTALLAEALEALVSTRRTSTFVPRPIV